MVRATRFGFTLIRKSSKVRAYTICIYSGQKKDYLARITQFAFILFRESNMVRATRFGFTLIRESSMIRAYIFRIFSDQGKQYGQSLHNLPLL